MRNRSPVRSRDGEQDVRRVARLPVARISERYGLSSIPTTSDFRSGVPVRRIGGIQGDIDGCRRGVRDPAQDQVQQQVFEVIGHGSSRRHRTFPLTHA